MGRRNHPCRQRRGPLVRLARPPVGCIVSPPVTCHVLERYPTSTLWPNRSGAATLPPDDREPLRRPRPRQPSVRRPDARASQEARLERGGREPKLTTILRLADGLGVEPGELVNRLRG